MEEEAIADVVRKFVESFGEPTDSRHGASLLTGKLRQHAELVGSEQQPSGLEEETTVRIERLVVQPGSDGERVVDLEALVSWTVALEGRRTHRGFSRLSGPVRVVRTDGGWKIADYLHDGRLRSVSTILGPTTWVAADDIRARVLAVDLGGRTTNIDLEVDNRSERDRAFGTAWFAARLVGPFWRWYPVQRAGARLEVAGREVIRTYLGIDRAFPEPPAELRLFLPLVSFGSKQWTGLDLRLAVNQRIEVASAASGPKRLPRALRLQFWAIRVAGVVALGLIAWWLLAR